MSLAPTIVYGDEWLDRIARFRFEAWSETHALAPSAFPRGRSLDDWDRLATQLVVLDQGQLLGALRYAQYPTLDATHHGDYYRRAGIDVEGPIGLPERLVVRGSARRRGVASVLTEAMSHIAVARGARNLISECSPEAAALLRKLGRRSLGPAPQDPRFPDTRFEWMLSDVDVIAAELATNTRAR